MPTPKRWHPVSRDLNDDPEIWEFTDVFGDRALRTWLEILAILDKIDNAWQLSSHWLAALSRKTRQKPATVRRELDWLVDKGWLLVDERAADGSPKLLRARNYWKFHKRREPNGANVACDQGTAKSPDGAPSYPNLSDPTYKQKSEEALPASELRTRTNGTRTGMPTATTERLTIEQFTGPLK